ncbi:FmdB family zinc ribbon protein [Candidatus Magnetomonas plexicatena]|uniref:FmdB family zinc ribbon protein n=1 Tax=Candidatus Magnetomonas plexicatena TaxID=2552947 RepID=UPI0011019DC1|nr:zinc ribbon domain-containing protein [Nitrospirales bacterium LBB_01]
MPIYEYVCEDCKSLFSVIQKMGEDAAVCIFCTSKNVKKQISTFSCADSSSGFANNPMPSGGFGGT